MEVIKISDSRNCENAVLESPRAEIDFSTFFYSIQHKKIVSWCPSANCTIQSSRLLSVAKPTFFLITDITATFTGPYIILKGFQQKTQVVQVYPLEAKFCDSLIAVYLLSSYI